MGLIKKPSLKGRKRAKKVKPVTIVLKNPFSINGVAYGPGTVEVSANLAATLQEQDRRVEAAEQKLFDKRAFIVQGRRGAVQVPPEKFNELLGASEPFTTVTER